MDMELTARTGTRQSTHRLSPQKPEANPVARSHSLERIRCTTWRAICAARQMRTGLRRELRSERSLLTEASEGSAVLGLLHLAELHLGAEREIRLGICAPFALAEPLGHVAQRRRLDREGGLSVRIVEQDPERGERAAAGHLDRGAAGRRSTDRQMGSALRRTRSAIVEPHVRLNAIHTPLGGTAEQDDVQPRPGSGAKLDRQSPTMAQEECGSRKLRFDHFESSHCRRAHPRLRSAGGSTERRGADTTGRLALGFSAPSVRPMRYGRSARDLAAGVW